MHDNLLNEIEEAGIVGAGGAGFPTAVKLKASPDCIVVNGAECEPILKVDQQLAEAFAQELMSTLQKLVTVLGAKRGIFALKEKYYQATKNLRKEAKNHPDLSIHALGNYYPMGDEQVLVYEVTGRIVPEGGIPLTCGVVVINVETLLNIYKAIELKKPVTEKYLTVAGAVKNPGTFKVPLGIGYAEIIAAAGGAIIEEPTLIVGGPMMGQVETNLDAPVTKTSKGLILLRKDHPLVLSKNRPIQEMMRIGKTACCQCMLCTDLCPRYMLGHRLHPDKLMRLASYNDTCEENAPATHAFLCCECGLCELACIMRLQPWKVNKELKKRLGAAGIKNPHRESPSQVNRFRSWRQFPIPKLIRMVGLAEYEYQPASLMDFPAQATSVRLRLKQHLGAPSSPAVSLHDKVVEGQMIATKDETGLGAHIHASINGRIAAIDDDCITIERDSLPPI